MNSLYPMKSRKISCCSEQLLPGIPDDITLGNITTKLPWSAFQILSTVSHGWRQAIRNREVHDARVSFKSTETMLVFRLLDLDRDVSALQLYSLRDKAFYQLPPLPPLNAGIPDAQFVSLDGKIYVWGGQPTLQDVYVLDLAGEGQWKPCASMLERRDRFACGVLDGKIYVFGGAMMPPDPDAIYPLDLIPVRGSEVYNPKDNVWSSITPIPTLRESHRVTTVGDEMYVVGGSYFGHELSADGTVSSELVQCEACFWEIYNPAKDNWRHVEPAGCDYLDDAFVAQGELYLATQDGISVYDNKQNVCTHLDSIWCDALGKGVLQAVPYAILAVDDDLFAGCLMRFANKSETCILQGRGFYSENKKIIWENVQCSFSFPHDSPYMCRIEL